MTLTLTPIREIPLIRPGDNLADILLSRISSNLISIQDGDILVIAQKIVSKAEGRMQDLTQVMPSRKAIELAALCDKKPSLVELILQESSEILRTRPGTIIVEHRLGFVCANAGIDHSNVAGEGSDVSDWVLLLPVDPDRSASCIRERIEANTQKRIGVMIVDSHGRAWRTGIVGACIGLSGLPALADMRGEIDLFGFTLRITQIAVADELAAAASLVMGQAAEGIPAVHVRGFPYPLQEGAFQDLIRPKEQDMFR